MTCAILTLQDSDGTTRRFLLLMVFLSAISAARGVSFAPGGARLRGPGFFEGLFDRAAFKARFIIFAKGVAG